MDDASLLFEYLELGNPVRVRSELHFDAARLTFDIRPFPPTSSPMDHIALEGTALGDEAADPSASDAPDRERGGGRA